MQKCQCHLCSLMICLYNSAASLQLANKNVFVVLIMVSSLMLAYFKVVQKVRLKFHLFMDLVIGENDYEILRK